MSEGLHTVNKIPQRGHYSAKNMPKTERKYSALQNVKYFRFCENVKYASRMKYSASPNVKYFHFLRKMKMCELEIKNRGQP